MLFQQGQADQSVCCAPRSPAVLSHTYFLPISRVYFTVECHALSLACSTILMILVLSSAPKAKLGLRPMETVEWTVAMRRIIWTKRSPSLGCA